MSWFVMSACSGGTDNGKGASSSSAQSSSGMGGAASSSSSGKGGEGGTIFAGSGGAGGGGGSAPACEPPDLLIVLDRTMSMHKRPDGATPADTAAGHMESKWYIAINAVEKLSASLEQKIRFGLELFPKDPGGGVCVTLSQRIQGMTATNPTCQKGEVIVDPNLNTGMAIATALDPEKTRLCTSTPIGQGLITAETSLAALKNPIREQFVMLISDGGDTCDAALPLTKIQDLAKAGIKTYVIAFDGTQGINEALLNDLSCAGQTSPGFPANCKMDAMGNYVWDSASAMNVFSLAENDQALNTIFDKIGADVCCDCVPK